MLVQQPPEIRIMVVVFQMGQFVDQNVFDAISWRLDQAGVHDDLTVGGTTSPLPGHVQHSERRRLVEPRQTDGQFAEPSGEMKAAVSIRILL